ncbi:hypothetical protein H6G36_26965 [Anabaena minutissima FACHB-250]|nr:hypothetical protein [Anabaena minutissima FACHB-250]
MSRQIMQSDMLVELSLEQQQLVSGGTRTPSVLGGSWSPPKTIEGSCDDLKDFDVEAACQAQSSRKLEGVSQESHTRIIDGNGQKSCSKRITYQCRFSLF